MKRNLLISVLLLMSFSAFAQKKAIVKFDKKKNDLGVINTADTTQLSKYFFFTNTGDATLLIDKVTTSRNEVSVICDNKKILSGKKGRIKIIFNPEMKRGDFDMNLVIFSNSGNKVDTMYVSSRIKHSIKASSLVPIK